MVRSLLKLKCKRNHDTPVFANHVERCYFQKTNDPNVWYLVYRWAFALFFILIFLWSIFDVKRHKNDQNFHKWPVFLTNWAITTAVIEAVLGLWIVKSAWLNRNKYALDEERKMTRLHKVFWIMNIFAIDMAFTVSAIYWGVVHDSKVHKVDALNILVHGGNSVMMFIEILMVAHPCKFIFFLFSAATGFSYSVFSYVYYACGGTDRDGNPYIYAPLDWRKPQKAALVCAMSMATTLVVHCIVYGLFMLKQSFTKTPKPEPIPSITLQEKSILLDVA